MIKLEGRGFKSHPGQSFLCPCVGPFPSVGLTTSQDVAAFVLKLFSGKSSFRSRT